MKLTERQWELLEAVEQGDVRVTAVGFIVGRSFSRGGTTTMIWRVHDAGLVAWPESLPAAASLTDAGRTALAGRRAAGEAGSTCG